MVSVLEVDRLSVEFHIEAGIVRAVNEVSFALEAGQTLAIVGESGSGKSATALSLLRLNPEPPCVYAGGRIIFGDRDLLSLSERQIRSVRGKGIAMVFGASEFSVGPVWS